MAELIADKRRGAPCTMRLFDASRLAPAWTGVLIAMMVLTGFWLLSISQGWIENAPMQGGSIWSSLQLRVELLQAALIGLLPTITAYGLRLAGRDLSALRPVLDLSESEFTERLESIGSFPGVWLPLVGVGGFAMGFGLASMEPFWASKPPSSLWWWVALRNGVMVWLFSRTVFIEIVVAVRFAVLGRDHARVDLLELSALRPFTSHGLRSVLFLMLFAALFSLMFAITPSRELVASMSISTLAIAVAALLLPVVGVHRRILDRKHAELLNVNAAIRRERPATLDRSDQWQPEDSRVSDLIVYRGLIESLNSWPIDVSTLLRFGLYLVVGLASWFGAALVERILGWALD
jgi:hypothetical protein